MAALRSMSSVWKSKLSHIARTHSLFQVPWHEACCFNSALSVERHFHSFSVSKSFPSAHRQAANVKLSFISPIIAHRRDFASGKPPSITDDILKTKQPNQSGDKDDQPKDSSDSTSNKEGKKESWFSGKNAWKLGLLSLFGMGCLMCGNMLIMWGAPMKDKDGNEIPDEFMQLPKWQAYPKRAWKEFHFFKQMIQEPSSHKLLPDPVQEPWYQPPYTLVLELTGVLVHPDWTLSTGWRFKKRPAIDYFLQQVGPPLFEVVVYTHEQGFTAFPIIDGLDPKGYISFRLFRDATRYHNGSHVKDLDCLNRDLSKVIIVDCDPKACDMHSRNAVPLKKWTGSDDDRTLVDLAQFLRTIATSGVQDVRTVLDHYNQFDDPIEAFKQNQLRLQEEMEKAAVVAKEQQEKKSLASAWSFGLTGRKR